MEKCLSLPFGDGQNCTNAATGLFFTGKRRDTETGNDYFGARYYASRMGSWMSPDWSAKEEPVPYAKMGNPQTLNLYGYVLNNPLTVADPDGHATQSPCADGQTCGFIANITGPSNEMALANAARIDTEAKAQNTVTGATVGAVIGGVGGAIIGGIAGGAGGTLVEPGGRTLVGIGLGGTEGAKDGAALGTLIGATLGAIYSEVKDAVSGPKAGSTDGPGSEKRATPGQRGQALQENGGKCVFCGKSATQQTMQYHARAVVILLR